MKAAVMVFVSLVAACGWSLPTVNGSVKAGEYEHSISLMDDDVLVYYTVDAHGGLYCAVVAPTKGWVGIGLGAVVMDGARIFMGYVKDGVPTFSEQVGEGHSHRLSKGRSADSFGIGQAEGMTTLEFHLPADKVPGVAGKVSFITAFSASADLSTYHDDNRDGGTIELSAP